MIFTPDERRALIALGGLLSLGLIVRLAVREPLPPPCGGDSLLVVLAAGGAAAPADTSFGGSSTASPGPPPGLAEMGLVRINEARLDDLLRLPRVGPRLAERILESRNKDGPFRSLQDLRRVKGIGAKTAELLKPCVSFDLAGAAAADCTARMQAARGPSARQAPAPTQPAGN